MEENKKFICIRCPRGCEIATTLDGYSITHIEGNVCRLGEEYVKSEISDPRRALTSTVKVKNGKYPLAPVWSSAPIPKDKILDVMKLIREVEIEAPVEIDRKVLSDVLGTGIDILVSGFVAQKSL